MKAFTDTETTGYAPGHISQLAAIKTDDDLNIIDTINQYFTIPKGTMEQGALEVHGLDELKLYELSEGKPFSRSAFRFSKWFQNCELICHNVEFDLRFLKTEFERCGITYNPGTKCTMKDFTKICRIPQKCGHGFKWPSLEETLEYLEITENEVSKKTKEIFGEVNSFHDARFDTTAVYLIYKKGTDTGILKGTQQRLGEKL